MKRMRAFYLLAVLGFSIGAVAQNTPKPAATPAQQTGVSGAIDRQVSTIEREFVGAAEAMPEDKYNFTPASLNIPNSDYKGVRTFAEEVKHVAKSNYELWGPITGDKSPLPSDSPNDNGPSSLKTKAEIVKYLKDSFALGHKVAQAMNEKSVAETVPNPFGKGQISKLFLATFTVAHAFDHYGQMVEYLRMNGIIPPASRGNQ